MAHLYVILALVLTFLAFCSTPSPYYMEVPGGRKIFVAFESQWNRRHRSRAYQVVTVDIPHATFASYLCLVNTFHRYWSAKGFTGGSTDAGFMRINQFYVQTSQKMAKYQGLKTAGKGYRTQVSGSLCLDRDRTIQLLGRYWTLADTDGY